MNDELRKAIETVRLGIKEGEDFNGIDFSEGVKILLSHAEECLKFQKMSSVERLWEIAHNVYGCKKTGEDCSVMRCAEWRNCKRFIETIHTLSGLDTPSGLDTISGTPATGKE